MEVRPTHTRFCGGRSTPAMRAIRTPSLSLALLVLRVAADHSHHAAPMNDLALVANLSDRRPNFHFAAPLRAAPGLLVPVNDAAARQVVRRKLDSNLVPGQDADEVLAHLSGDVRQHSMLVLELNAKHRVGQWLDHRRHDLDGILLRIARVSLLLIPLGFPRHGLLSQFTRTGRSLPAVASAPRDRSTSRPPCARHGPNSCRRRSPRSICPRAP